MALAINTNVSALNAHMNMKKTDNALTSSLGRLSTGLRINKAADDASGMSIADSLKAQSNGLGQAIRNANDGINIVQTADGALDEAVNIVNTIKTKSIQAAQDGQTYESRKIIQEDINKLLEEVDLLANSTSFNGKKLLSGEFTNASFQVGASTGETANVSIGSAQTTKTGHVTTADLSVVDEGELTLKIHSNADGKDYELQAVDMQYNNSAENGIGALADVINRLSDDLGISATASVQTSSRGNVVAGEIAEGFKINGVDIGAVSVMENDTDGALAKAINSKSDLTGVTASVDSTGQLTMTSTDNRAIQVEGDVKEVMGGITALEMSTFGELKITQTGSNSLLINDAESGIETQMATITTADDILVKDDMLLTGGSIFSGSTLTAGTVIGEVTTGGNKGYTTNATAELTSVMDHNIAAGSTLSSGSVIESGTTIGGSINVVAATETITGDATLAAGTVLASGTQLTAGTVLTDDIVNNSGDVIKAGTTLSVTTTLAGEDVTLTSDMTIEDSGTNAILATGSTIAIGSTLEDDDLLVQGNTTILQDFTLKEGSALETGSILAAGSVLGANDRTADAVTISTTMEVAAGSTLNSGTVVNSGSTIGGTITTSKAAAVTVDNELTMGTGSTLKSGTTIAAGTYLTNAIETTNGTVGPGVTLEQDAQLTRDLYLTENMTLENGSSLQTGSLINSTGGGLESDIEIDNVEVTRLSDIDVTSQEGAQIAIAVADSALKDYDKIRANLGSVQNQLTSTISNISTTQVNVKAAESTIRDVDFAEESQTFSKLQILAQSGSYAMSQANSSSQNVMSLLQ